MKILFTTLFDPDDLGSRYLSAYLKQFGHEVRIVALNTYSVSEYTFFPTLEEIEQGHYMLSTGVSRLGSISIHRELTDTEYLLYSEELKNWQPDIIGIGTRSMNLKYFPVLIPIMRKSCPKAFIVAGGIGPTLDPDKVLGFGVDAVIRGEGEYALLELMTALEKGENWRIIKNVSYTENGKVIKNILRPQEKDLNVFPLPIIKDTERVLITNQKRYSFADADIPWKNNNYVTVGSRGCILDCSYCGGRSILEIYGDTPCYKYRQRSLKNLRKELEQVLPTRTCHHINFRDEFFVYPVEEMKEFFTWYKNNVSCSFTAHFSASQLYNHPELLDLVFEAGLYYYPIGVQSGDEEFCRRVYNRNNNNNEILTVIKRCYEKDLSLYCYMIMGNPLETEENIKNTFKFCLQFPKIDPSLKRQIMFLINKLFVPIGDSLIKKSFPELMHLTFPNKEFYRQAMLLECCLLLDEKEFWDLYHNEFYKENPQLLADFYYQRLNAMHEAYLTKEFAELTDQKVWVFGGGSAWQQKKHKLKDVQIEGILMDFENVPQAIDGIPVLQPKQAFSEHPEYPVIIVAKKENINLMYKKMISQYRYRNSDNIILCADLPRRES